MDFLIMQQSTDSLSAIENVWLCGAPLARLG